VQKELERKKKRADLMCKRNYKERKKERSKAKVARGTHIAQIMVLRRVVRLGARGLQRAYSIKLCFYKLLRTGGQEDVFLTHSSTTLDVCLMKTKCFDG
jgi:hypothetical protein